MVFHSITTIAFVLIASSIGYWVLVTSRRDEAESLKGFGNILGYFIIISAFILFIITSYYSVRYWEDGHDSMRHYPGQMMGSMSMHGSGQGMTMVGSHSDCPMMIQGGADHKSCMAGMKSGMQSHDMHTEKDDSEDDMKHDHQTMQEDQGQE